MSEKQNIKIDQESLQKYQAFIKELCNLILTKDLEEIKKGLQQHIKDQQLLKIDKNKKDKDDKLTIQILLNEIKEGNGKNVMHLAAQRGDLQIFQYLIEQGGLNNKFKVFFIGDYTQSDSDGNSCFFHAIQQNHLELISYLHKEKKVNINEERKGKVMAIHLASSNDKKGETINYLIQNGANIEAASDELGTPLTWAVASQNTVGAKILLQQEKCNLFGVANPHLPPPIIIAIDSQNYEIIELFLTKNKECINQQDPQGNKCLHVAAEKGDIKIIKQLLDAGANVNDKCNGKEPIKIAMEHEQWDCVAFLRNFTAPDVLKELKEEESKKQSQVVEDEFKNLSQEEKEAKALELKEQGNAQFQAKEYNAAISLYKESLKLNSKLIASYSNIAACYISIKEPVTALEYCAKARKIDEKWLKTFFREGEAYMQLEEYGDAAASFWEGYRVEPNNKAFYQGFQKAVKLGKEKVAKEKEKEKKE